MRKLAVLVVVMLATLPWTQSLRADEGFQPLFDGTSLKGWVGDPRLWSVSEGTIVGSTEKHTIKTNTFLSTEKSYANFVLRLKFKLRNHNSGVQYRSRQLDDYVVSGYQADIADKRYTGILYEERGRGILQDVDPDVVASHVKQGQWNQYIISANGPHLTQTINGYKTVDYTEKSKEGATKGIFALQLHVGPKMRAAFKDIEIKILP